MDPEIVAKGEKYARGHLPPEREKKNEDILAAVLPFEGHSVAHEALTKEEMNPSGGYAATDKTNRGYDTHGHAKHLADFDYGKWVKSQPMPKFGLEDREDVFQEAKRLKDEIKARGRAGSVDFNVNDGGAMDGVDAAWPGRSRGAEGAVVSYEQCVQNALARNRNANRVGARNEGMLREDGGADGNDARHGDDQAAVNPHRKVGSSRSQKALAEQIALHKARGRAVLERVVDFEGSGLPDAEQLLSEKGPEGARKRFQTAVKQVMAAKRLQGRTGYEHLEDAGRRRAATAGGIMSSRQKHAGEGGSSARPPAKAACPTTFTAPAHLRPSDRQQRELCHRDAAWEAKWNEMGQRLGGISYLEMNPQVREVYSSFYGSPGGENRVGGENPRSAAGPTAKEVLNRFQFGPPGERRIQGVGAPAVVDGERQIFEENEVLALMDPKTMQRGVNIGANAESAAGASSPAQRAGAYSRGVGANGAPGAPGGAPLGGPAPSMRRCGSAPARGASAFGFATEEDRRRAALREANRRRVGRSARAEAHQEFAEYMQDVRDDQIDDLPAGYKAAVTDGKTFRLLGSRGHAGGTADGNAGNEGGAEGNEDARAAAVSDFVERKRVRAAIQGRHLTGYVNHGVLPRDPRYRPVRGCTGSTGCMTVAEEGAWREEAEKATRMGRNYMVNSMQHADTRVRKVLDETKEPNVYSHYYRSVLDPVARSDSKGEDPTVSAALAAKQAVRARRRQEEARAIREVGGEEHVRNLEQYLNRPLSIVDMRELDRFGLMHAPRAAHGPAREGADGAGHGEEANPDVADVAGHAADRGCQPSAKEVRWEPRESVVRAAAVGAGSERPHHHVHESAGETPWSAAALRHEAAGPAVGDEEHVARAINELVARAEDEDGQVTMFDLGPNNNVHGGAAKRDMGAVRHGMARLERGEAHLSGSRDKAGVEHELAAHEDLGTIGTEVNYSFLFTIFFGYAPVLWTTTVRRRPESDVDTQRVLFSKRPSKKKSPIIHRSSAVCARCVGTRLARSRWRTWRRPRRLSARAARSLPTRWLTG